MFALFTPGMTNIVIIEGISGAINCFSNNIALDMKFTMCCVYEVEYIFRRTSPLGERSQREVGFATADWRFDDVYAPRLEGAGRSYKISYRFSIKLLLQSLQSKDSEVCYSFYKCTDDTQVTNLYLEKTSVIIA